MDTLAWQSGSMRNILEAAHMRMCPSHMLKSCMFLAIATDIDTTKDILIAKSEGQNIESQMGMDIERYLITNGK
jgi:hypothetical protein